MKGLEWNLVSESLPEQGKLVLISDADDRYCVGSWESVGGRDVGDLDWVVGNQYVSWDWVDNYDYVVVKWKEIE